LLGIGIGIAVQDFAIIVLANRLRNGGELALFLHPAHLGFERRSLRFDILRTVVEEHFAMTTSSDAPTDAASFFPHRNSVSCTVQGTGCRQSGNACPYDGNTQYV
jgi:hypothetical protein